MRTVVRILEPHYRVARGSAEAGKPAAFLGASAGLTPARQPDQNGLLLARVKASEPSALWPPVLMWVLSAHSQLLPVASVGGVVFGSTTNIVVVSHASSAAS